MTICKLSIARQSNVSRGISAILNVRAGRADRSAQFHRRQRTEGLRPPYEADHMPIPLATPVTEAILTKPIVVEGEAPQ
jgi:hypothetical protein